MITRPKVTDIIGLGDFPTSYDWYLQFIQYPPLSIIASTDDLNLRCLSSTVPKLSESAPINIDIRGHEVRQPGIFDYNGSITLTFVETANRLITKMLAAWREACWQSITGMQGTKKDVVATVRLVPLDRANKESWEYVMYNCWLQTYSSGGDLGNTSAIVQPTATLVYDYFTENIVT